MSSWFSSITGFFSSKNTTYPSLNSVLNVLEKNQENFSKELEELKTVVSNSNTKDMNKTYETLKNNLKSALEEDKKIQESKQASAASQTQTPSQMQTQMGGRRKTKLRSKKVKLGSKKSKSSKRKLSKRK
jgi:hypothetical protein